jgi:hypothetical protein
MARPDIRIETSTDHAKVGDVSFNSSTSEKSIVISWMIKDGSNDVYETERCVSRYEDSTNGEPFCHTCTQLVRCPAPRL